jgi:hypothetical protein
MYGQLGLDGAAFPFSLPFCFLTMSSQVAHGLGTEAQGGVSTFVEMLTYRHLPAKDLLLKYTDGWEKGKNGRTRFYDVRLFPFLPSFLNILRYTPLANPLTLLLDPHPRVRPPPNLPHPLRPRRNPLSPRRSPHLRRHRRLCFS